MGAATLLGGLEVLRNDGPWQQPEDYRKVNGLLRLSSGDAGRGYALLTLSGYEQQPWDSTDQIPLQPVADGTLDRFGGLDASDGGTSRRYVLTGEVWRGAGDTLTRLRAYAVRYQLDLFSNFTYFLDDEENGGTSSSSRTTARSSASTCGSSAASRSRVDATLRYGLQARWDDRQRPLQVSCATSPRHHAAGRYPAARWWPLGRTSRRAGAIGSAARSACARNTGGPASAPTSRATLGSATRPSSHPSSR